MTTPSRVKVQNGRESAEAASSGHINLYLDAGFATGLGGEFTWQSVAAQLPLSIRDLLRMQARSAIAEERQALGRAFARQAKSEQGVRAVRLTAVEPELVVTVVTEDRDMQRDMRLQRLFIETAEGFPENDWSLRVIVGDETEVSDETSLL
jgi:hypothetical protein